VAEAVLRPKVQGTAVLFDVVRDLKPDFLVLFSSISSVAAHHGQGDYCAANAFLDAFARYAKHARRFSHHRSQLAGVARSRNFDGE